MKKLRGNPGTTSFYQVRRIIEINPTDRIASYSSSFFGGTGWITTS